MITSKQNSAILAASKLNDKKGRKEQGLFLIEGQKLVFDAFKHGIAVQKVFVSADVKTDFSSYGCEVVEVSPEVMKVLSDTKTNQGVVAVAKLPDKKPYCGGNALLLDRIQDPKNIGAIIRTACATGYNDVFLIDCADVFSPKSLRSGMSGQFMLNFIETSEEEFVKNFEGKRILCADMQGENIFEFSCGEHILILGNEGQGVSDVLASLATNTVRIPMENNLESLNVAVSAGIIMYQLNRDKWRK